MTPIADLARWFACGMRLLSSWRMPSDPCRGATPTKTATPSDDCAGSWRLLTANCSAPGSRYLVRRTTNTHRLSVYIYDLRTSLIWRCDFSSQRERNRYLGQLRRGYTDHRPAAVLAAGVPSIC